MTRARWFPQWRLILALVMLISLIQAVASGQSTRLHPRRIAIFGSSVANGTGDEFGTEGFTGALRRMMAARGWEVLNQSRGGDTTPRLTDRWAPAGVPDPKVRYLTTVSPTYVVIMLSLGNEGIFEAKTKDAKEAVFKQYNDGIRSLVDRARQQNIVSVITLAYPRGDYTPVEHEYVRRANLLQALWDVPSINFLGAIDDGAGKWAKGFGDDRQHPNAEGHKEFLYATVPTLFEALEKGKPIPARPAGPRGFIRVAAGVEPLTFTPDEKMHPFAISMMVRAQGDGSVTTISGSTLVGKNEVKRVPRGQTTVEFDSMPLTTDRPFRATIAVQNGKWAYVSAGGINVVSSVNADAQWHHIVLSHYTARGETLLYADGTLAGRVAERLEPSHFVFGGSGSAGSPGPKQADYRDLFLFRAALNADEVAVLGQGKILQGSLEIYSPLNDVQFKAGSMVENRAQSLTGLRVGSDKIARIEEAVTN
jgi:lysophospholipase L1-like esterase